MIRHCMDCGRTIEECMGYVLARDVLAVMWGERPREMRERCGVCVARRSVASAEGEAVEADR